MDKGLFFDTSTPQGLLLYMEGDQLIHHETFPCGVGEKDLLLPTIQSLLQSKSLTPKDLSYLAVGIGPGSYTGIRTSATVAMTLCYANSLPCVAFPSLTRLLPSTPGPFVSLTDAKRKKLFIQFGIRTDTTIQWTSEPTMIPAEDLPLQVSSDMRLVSTQRDKLEPHLELSNTWDEGDGQLQLLAKLCHDAFERGEFATINPLKLFYLQEPYIGTSK